MSDELKKEKKADVKPTVKKVEAPVKVEEKNVSVETKKDKAEKVEDKPVKSPAPVKAEVKEEVSRPTRKKRKIVSRIGIHSKK